MLRKSLNNLSLTCTYNKINVFQSVTPMLDTLCGCDTCTSRHSHKTKAAPTFNSKPLVYSGYCHSNFATHTVLSACFILAPTCHLLWSRHHPGCSPSARSNVPGEFVGSCLGLSVTCIFKQSLLDGSIWWLP